MLVHHEKRHPAAISCPEAPVSAPSLMDAMRVRIVLVTPLLILLAVLGTALFAQTTETEDTRLLLQVVSAESNLPVDQFELWAAAVPAQEERNADGSRSTMTFALGGPGRWPISRVDATTWAIARPRLAGARFVIRARDPHLGWARHAVKRTFFPSPSDRTEPIVVRLPRTHERSVIVRGPDGATIADARVDLVIPIYAEGRFTPDPMRRLHDLAGELVDEITDTNKNRSAIIATTRTDEHGKAILQGPAGMHHGLQIIAPGYEIATSNSFVFAEEDRPETITLSRAATLLIRPEPTLAELREAHPGLGLGESLRQGRHFDLHLRNDAWKLLPAHQTRHREDGSLVYEHAPAGLYALVSQSWRTTSKRQDLDGTTSSTLQVFLAPSLRLVAGKTTEVSVDLRPALAMPVSIEIRGPDGPLRDTWVNIVNPAVGGGWGTGSGYAATSSRGRIYARMVPGTYRITDIAAKGELHRTPANTMRAREFTVRPMQALDVVIKLD